ncbi:ABC-type glycerol-3-phosphate transport system substrate-binding protein [Bifidobacterium commune]|uniref:extracellular solute-binding protein n=1 Tax=Bifidobacterium commune TaxID=1505727 RepID=UPI000B83E940|nr:extracellular solute-binding protein [Bifidobacterium commune]MBB2955172.1 ABC-type glycerol-3-phosphate transport system substrate-binding protein [Bifidobacterium commune]
MGTFPIPGKSGKNQPTLVAGSDWAVSAKSKHQDMALKWIEIATGDEIEQKWVFDMMVGCQTRRRVSIQLCSRVL